MSLWEQNEQRSYHGNTNLKYAMGNLKLLLEIAKERIKESEFEVTWGELGSRDPTTLSALGMLEALNILRRKEGAKAYEATYQVYTADIRYIQELLSR